LQQGHKNGAFTATILLGQIYELGQGVEVNLPKAVELYSEAADQNSFQACIFLARVFVNQDDSKEAKKWYEKAVTLEDGIDDEMMISEAKVFLSSAST